MLRIVRSGDLAAAREMQDICLGFVAGQSDRQARAFWKICAGFFEALAQGRLAPDVYVKRVASRVLMQYATLARGEPTVADRLVQDLLFFCSQARPASDDAAAPPADQSVLHAVRQAFGLERFRPVDYSTPRFGLYDPALLAQARKRIAAATETWSALAGGDRNKLKPAADQFSLVCDSLAKLQPGSEPLSRALSRAVDSTVRSGEPPLPALAMEVATAVLYLQASFEELETAQDHMADRASRLAERLDSVAAGGESAPLEPWMEELYRRVSDHQTMGSVVDELRATLGEVEKSLDQYFRSPGDLPVLGSVPGRLAQMRGVLSVLGLDQASLAVVHMRDTVERLLRGDVPEEERQAVFEKLGSNLGALGFLIDMLSYQRTMARKLFIYDEPAGELRILMGRTRTRAGDLPEEQDAHIEARAPVPAPLPLVPDGVQPPIGDGPAAPEASRVAPVAAPVPAAVAPAAPMASEEEADDEGELLDIFLEEAREVVANGLEAVEGLRSEPADLSGQTTLRRAFHTLKGSSRMVGLNDFGEAAWSMEQVLNAWLAEQKPIQPPMLQLSDEALRAFGRWADDIAAGRTGGWEPRGFAESAQAMRERGEYLPLAGAAAVAAGVATEAPSTDVPAEEAPHAGSPAVDDAGLEAHPASDALAPDALDSDLSMDFGGQDAAAPWRSPKPPRSPPKRPLLSIWTWIWTFPPRPPRRTKRRWISPRRCRRCPMRPRRRSRRRLRQRCLRRSWPKTSISRHSPRRWPRVPPASRRKPPLPAAHDDAPLPEIPDASSPDAALQAAGMPPLADLLAEAELLPDAAVPLEAAAPLAEPPADAWPDLSLDGEFAPEAADAGVHAGSDARLAAMQADADADGSALDVPGADAQPVEALAPFPDDALEAPVPAAAGLPVEPEAATADSVPLPEHEPGAEGDVPAGADESSTEAGADPLLGPSRRKRPSRSSRPCASAFPSTTSISTRRTSGRAAWSPACRNGRWSCTSRCRTRPWHWPTRWPAAPPPWASRRCRTWRVRWSMPCSTCNCSRRARQSRRVSSWRPRKTSAACCTSSPPGSSRSRIPRSWRSCARSSSPRSSRHPGRSRLAKRRMRSRTAMPGRTPKPRPILVPMQAVPFPCPPRKSLPRAAMWRPRCLCPCPRRTRPGEPPARRKPWPRTSTTTSTRWT